MHTGQLTNGCTAGGEAGRQASRRRGMSVRARLMSADAARVREAGIGTIGLLVELQEARGE